MSNEQKQGFFSRILRNSFESSADNTAPDEEAAVQAVPETPAATKPDLPAGRGVFAVPTHSMLHTLWQEWEKTSMEYGGGDILHLVMETPDVRPVPMSDDELEKEKQKIAAKLLMESKKRYKLIHPEKAEEPADVDADVVVSVSRDGMGAWVFLFPPSGNGSHITYEQLQESILSEMLSYGIDTAKIPQIAEHPPYFKLILIARGLPMIPGKDGWIEDRFPHQLDNSLGYDEHGNVDYRSKTNMQVVHEGDILSEAFPASPGTAGMTVLGTEVPPVDGKVPALSGGFNTTLSEDRMTLKASMDGHLQYKNDVFHVQPLFHVFGNVDFGVGNIDFPGDVHITGDVQNGFIVQAKGNITVDGLVEGAVLEAGGSIIVRKGVLGDGRAVIRAQQSVTAQFLENCVVYAGNSVMSSSIITSAVHSDNEIVVRSGRGIVIGGKLTATNLISATVIGSRSERLTELTIGDLPFIKQQREEIIANLEQAEKDEEAVERNIQYLDIGDAIEEDMQRAANRAQLLAKQRLQKNIITMKKERYLKELRELDQKRIDLDDCRIISDMIYPVTKVQIGEIKHTIEKLSLNCNIHVSPIADEILVE